MKNLIKRIYSEYKYLKQTKHGTKRNSTTILLKIMKKYVIKSNHANTTYHKL